MNSIYGFSLWQCLAGVVRLRRCLSRSSGIPHMDFMAEIAPEYTLGIAMVQKLSPAWTSLNFRQLLMMAGICGCGPVGVWTGDGVAPGDTQHRRNS